MEPPAKRLKVGQLPPHDDRHNEANDDELSLHPGEFEARQDPLYELDKSRAKAAFKLKSRFESIFDKYERDFEGEGDEIDLHTGEVIINNGHLLSLEDEKDKEDLSADEEEEERILQGKNPPSTSTSLISGNSTPYNAALQLQNHWAHPPLPNDGLPSFSGLPTPAQNYGMPHPLTAFGAATVDPLWQTPDLQMGGPQGHLGLFANAYHGQMNPFQNSYGGGIGRLLHRRAPRRIATAKELAVRNRQDAFLGEELVEDEDNAEDEDRLLGVSKEDSSPKQQSDSSRQKPQEHISKPSATSSKEDVSRDDTITKGGSTTTANVSSGSHGLSGVSSKIHMENVTSTRSPGPQLQQEGHYKPMDRVVEPSSTTKNDQIPEKRSSFVIELRSTPGGGDMLQKQLVAKKIRKENPLQEEAFTCDSQGRRPGRPRSKPEFYGDVSLLKMRRTKAEMDTILDYSPSEESRLRFETPNDQPDTEMVIADVPDDSGSLIEGPPSDITEELRPGDVGNEAFIEAAESIFLSRLDHSADSKDEGVAHEPTPTNLSKPQLQATAGTEPAKPIQQAESFSRNLIDPSYNFSDDEDEVEIPVFSELQKDAETDLGKSAEPEGEDSTSTNCTSGMAVTLESKQITELPTTQVEEIPPPVEFPSTATTVETTDFSRTPFEENVAEITNAAAQEVGEEPEENVRAASSEIVVDQSANADDIVARRASSPVEGQCPSSPTTRSKARNVSPNHPSGPEPSPLPLPSWTVAKPRRPIVDSDVPRTPTKKTKQKRSHDEERGEEEKKKSKKQPTTSETNRLTSSAKKHALASLVPDNSDDEDEISILAHTPTSSRHEDIPPSSSPPRNTAEPLTPSHRARNRRSLGSTARSGSRYVPATDSRALGLGVGASSSSVSRRRSKANHRSSAFSSPLLQRVLKTPRTGRRYHLPLSTAAEEEEGLVRTPGGTTRRCGVGGRDDARRHA
ncbi:hypothetical protein PG999_001003 [Apiospora kogelbergensis]|uniref:Centromere protein Scm3 n=1 Tax=Apiospora kogelbergensis TaxID=1337665 RepID=A0AAW0RD38_9PEZI